VIFWNFKFGKMSFGLSAGCCTIHQAEINGKIVFNDHLKRIILNGSNYFLTMKGRYPMDWKLNNVMVLQQEEGANVTVNTLHPGAIRTKLTYLDGFLGLLSGMNQCYSQVKLIRARYIY